jgi:hypothetical protein
MEIDDILLDKLVDLIYRRLRDGAWLYWPVGPMINQVFDKTQCKNELRRFIEAQP